MLQKNYRWIKYNCYYRDVLPECIPEDYKWYVFQDAYDIVLYIGHCNNVITRIQSHNIPDIIYKEMPHITDWYVMLLNTKDICDLLNIKNTPNNINKRLGLDIERDLISLFNPVFNQRGLEDKQGQLHRGDISFCEVYDAKRSNPNDAYIVTDKSTLVWLDTEE